METKAELFSFKGLINVDDIKNRGLSKVWTCGVARRKSAQKIKTTQKNKTSSKTKISQEGRQTKKYHTAEYVQRRVCFVNALVVTWLFLFHKTLGFWSVAPTPVCFALGVFA